MQPDKRTRPDTVLLLATGGYAAFNVVLMLLYANSLLGPVPFGLIFFFLMTSAVGATAMLPAYFFFRSAGLTVIATFVATVVFAALIWFNAWCLFSASAAV